MERDWLVLLAFFIFMAGLGSAFFDAISHGRKPTSRKSPKPAPDSRN